MSREREEDRRRLCSQGSPRLLNMQNFNLAWVKGPVARVIIPSHGEGKQIAQDLLKVARYIVICVQLCAVVQKPHETGDAN